MGDVGELGLHRDLTGDLQAMLIVSKNLMRVMCSSFLSL